ncbi:MULTISPECIES: NUDIX hydrolase [Limosilactobacillus]|jgi:mutator protein MutT|uniref:NUDIX hydrolase n=1 Tax=Limosilactobacillus pontis DSM 8475 TaxID=1423794 RepID=A0A922PUA7_9LACO|nr:NUDIX hydrolase [Limosilactobacillus pontis]KRM35379.1 NUDIX hydrolase [Limosilactobacillus pontis DSM 8475]MCX2186027.1 NUDIX hydrolase [Limosilactobacillus pontis]MCX2187768.1 NUDIX hydrolase [Limosilactobacillus pontis]QFV00928.1 NUDIX domain-containing protein [Limosilactobacillus pontis]
MAYIKEIRDLVGHRPLILTSASGALVTKQGAVLLQERADTGDWGFPGGYMEFGETFAQTAVREFKEDAGIVVQPVKLLGMFDSDTYTYPNGDLVQPVNAFYLVNRVDDHQYATKLSETVTTRYFSLHAPAPRFFNRQHAEMWAALKEYLAKH